MSEELRVLGSRDWGRERETTVWELELTVGSRNNRFQVGEPRPRPDRRATDEFELKKGANKAEQSEPQGLKLAPLPPTHVPVHTHTHSCP